MVPEHDYYTGQWRSGKKNGRGKFVWSDGDVYDGDWVDNQKHGCGVYTYHKRSNCKSYNGDWRDGKKCGQGTIRLV